MSIHNPDPAPVQHRAQAGISLLGGFRLLHGSEPHDLPPGCQRLLAFLALHRQSYRRTAVAGALWPESSEVRAHASLRSAVARLQRATPGVLHINASQIGIAAGVTVDLHAARARAHALLEQPPRLAETASAHVAVAQLGSELLPGWYDDWVLLECENWRQLRLHALEALARCLAASGRFGDAVAAALAAVAADPLRESAHAALIVVHLAEGNRSEALRALTRYRKLLHRELGLAPTANLEALVAAPPRVLP